MQRTRCGAAAFCDGRATRGAPHPRQRYAFPSSPVQRLCATKRMRRMFAGEDSQPCRRNRTERNAARAVMRTSRGPTPRRYSVPRSALRQPLCSARQVCLPSPLCPLKPICCAQRMRASVPTEHRSSRHAVSLAFAQPPSRFSPTPRRVSRSAAVCGLFLRFRPTAVSRSPRPRLSPQPQHRPLCISRPHSGPHGYS